MRSKNINKDASGNGPGSDFINRTLERHNELQFFDSQTVKVEQMTRGTRFHAKIPPAGGAGGGFMGEYDQTKEYSAGQTFLISTAMTIATVAVVAGYYGVPPGGVDVNSLPWAGFVPANPTANAVPQSPLPSLGAAPNDKFYAKLIMPIC